jgi:3-isopropylmalate/(R)-2-methylmalate dehydratase small subunit
MQPIRTFTSRTVVLPSTNIDTDQIIPARFLTTTTKEGLGRQLFADWRYDASGAPRPDFVLNQPQAAGCAVLVAGRNFGCGSSREHAPWALLDYGIRCVISTSFADIFYNNCFKNGILPIVVPPEDLRKLMDDAERGANATIMIDLPKQEIRGPDGGTIRFDIDAFRKHCLLNGLDDIGLTEQKNAEIASYEQRTRASHPWLFGMTEKAPA